MVQSVMGQIAGEVILWLLLVASIAGFASNLFGSNEWGAAAVVVSLVLALAWSARRKLI